MRSQALSLSRERQNQSRAWGAQRPALNQRVAFAAAAGSPLAAGAWVFLLLSASQGARQAGQPQKDLGGVGRRLRVAVLLRKAYP